MEYTKTLATPEYITELRKSGDDELANRLESILQERDGEPFFFTQISALESYQIIKSKE